VRASLPCWSAETQQWPAQEILYLNVGNLKELISCLNKMDFELLRCQRKLFRKASYVAN